MIVIKQTEDKELLTEIMKQLKEHNGHCPCQFDDTAKSTVCICESFKKMFSSKIPGVYECPCGRYIATITEN